MAITRSQLVKELEPGLNALFGLEYKRYENEHEEIFSIETSDRAFEEEVMLTGFGAAPVKTEGAGVQYDNAIESFTARYTHETIAMAFALTEEAPGPDHQNQQQQAVDDDVTGFGRYIGSGQLLHQTHQESTDDGTWNALHATDHHRGQGEQANGTLLVVEADDIAAVSEFVADDPYSQAGVFRSVEIRPWSWTVGVPESLGVTT